MKGPYGAKIEYLRVHNNGTYYVTAVVDDGRRLLKSTDQGRSWTKLPQLPQGLDTSSLTLASEYSFSIYSIELGTDSTVYLRYQYPNQQSNEYRTSAIYITTNDGQDWKKIYDSALTLSITGKQGECVITVTDSFSHGAKRINNDGAFLDSTYLPDSYPSSYYWVSDSTYIRAGSLISISHDNCKTWSVYDFPPLGNKVKVIEYITRGPNNVFYINCLDNVSTRRIYKGNFSEGWTKLGDPPANLGRISALSNDRIIGFDSYWPQTYKPLYILNTDWPVMTKSKSMPIPPDMITDDMFITDPLDGIIFPTGEVVFRSSDFGLTWQEFPIPYSDVTSIHVNGAGHIFTKRGSTSNFPMSYVNSYVSKSTDAGQTWAKTSPRFRAPNGYIGAGFDGGTIITVNDTIGKGMDIWHMGTESNSEWKKLARTVDPFDSSAKEGSSIAHFTLVDSVGNMFLGEKLLYRSDDKGMSWDAEISQPPLGITLACFSPTWKLYGLGSSGRKTTMSPDLGKTWKPIYYNKAFMNGSIVSVCAPTDSAVFAGNTVEGVSVSFDHGRNWKKLKGPWGDSITCVAYTKNNEVFIGTRSKGLFTCDYKGLNPRQEPLNIPFNRVLSLYVDKGKDVYIGTQGSGVWKSEGTIVTSVHDKVRSDKYQAEIVHSINGVSLRITSTTLQTFDISLFDALGKELRSLPNKSFSNGTYIIPFDITNTPTGSYFIRLRNNNTEQILKFQH